MNLKVLLKKRFIPLYILLILLFSAYPVLTSSWAFRHIYLPALSEKAKVCITADEVYFSLLHSHRNLRVRNLVFFDPKAADYIVHSGYADVSRSALLRGVLSMDNACVDGGEMVLNSLEPLVIISDLVLDAEKQRFNHFRIRNFTLSWTLDQSKLRFEFPESELSGIRMGKENFLTTKGGTVSGSWNGLKLKNVPLEADMRFRINRRFNVNALVLNLDSGVPTAENCFAYDTFQFHASGLLFRMKYGMFDRDGKIHSDLTCGIRADELRIGNAEPLKMPVFLLHKIDRDCPATGEFFVDKITAGLFIDGNRVVQLNTEAPLYFRKCNDDYTFIPNHFKCGMTIRDFPLAPFQSFLPVASGNAKADLDFALQMNPGKKNLSGKLQGSVRGFPFYSERKKDEPDNSFRFHAELLTDGITNVESFGISSCSMNLDLAGQNVLSAALAGNCKLSDLSAKLKGALKTRPELILSAANTKSSHDFLRWLQLCKHRDRTNVYDVSLATEPEKQQVVFSVSGQSKNQLSLPGKDESAPFNLTARSIFVYEPGKQMLLVDPIQVEWGNFFAMKIHGKTAFPHRNSDCSVEISRLSPELLRSVVDFTLHPENIANKRCHYATPEGLISSSRIHFSSRPEENRILIQPFSIQYGVNGPAFVICQSRKNIVVDTKTMQISGISPLFTIRELPIQAFQCLLPENSELHFRQGRLNGTLETEITDLNRNFDLNTNLTLSRPSFAISDTVCLFDDCRLSGTVSVKDRMGTLATNDLLFVSQVPGGEPQICRLNGIFEFQGRGFADVMLVVPQIRPGFLQQMYPKLNRYVHIGKLDSTGILTFHRQNVSAPARLSLKIKMKSLQLQSDKPAEYQFPDLHGDLDLDYLQKEEGFFECKTQFRMADEKDKERFHLEYRLRSEEMTRAILQSKGLDLDLIREILCRNPEDEKTDAAISKPIPEPVPVPQKGKPEPEREKPFQLDVRLQNLSFSDALSCNIRGRITQKDGIYRTNGLKIDGYADGEIAFQFESAGKKGEEPYSLEILFRNASLKPLFEYLCKKAGCPLPEVSGIVRTCHLQANGQGLSQAAMKKNLNLAVIVDLANLAVPISDAASSALFRVLFLPICYLPRLIDGLPDQVAKISYLKNFGDHLDLFLGQKQLEIVRGKIRISAKDGAMKLDHCRFTGPYIDTEIRDGVLDVFNNRLDVKLNMHFAGIYWPLHFSGPINNPGLNIPEAIVDFSARNTADLILDTADTFSFGILKRDPRFSELNEKTAIPLLPCTDPAAPKQEKKP